MGHQSNMPMALVGINGESCAIVDASRVGPVTASSPAVDVMTDLRQVAAATVDPDTGLADAQRIMVLRAVRSLLVVDRARSMIGLITASDLLGERPLQLCNQRGVRMQDLTVRDAMTPISAVQAVTLTEVMKAVVGDVVATLRHCGRQHMLVVERDRASNVLVRGIFSSSQIARQLGIPVQTTEVARTFAEIEAALHT
ncbi:CBS domain-containing protein [Cognatazoarcus halotolerans]|uniref:CBS domain-containing protein n=1 Tax=Cognatazoarcus halotolerans TaxID=2686016 RepID=UPI00190FB107|nr:CBS domain-containing protein [Cognatazoarcus halotolerans]MCB1901606.1 CBS domain-containing protein [Rhodocyclaceae bacterium]